MALGLWEGAGERLRRVTVLGFVFTLLSAFFFAVSGPIAKAFYEVGWTAGSVVSLRLAGAALLISVPTLMALKGQWSQVRRQWKIIATYGLVTMAGVQAFFFLALEHLSVAIAVLLEMMGAPLIIVFWLWARSKRPPTVTTGVGVVVSLIGVILVLDFSASSASWIGVIFALGAAACFACYFLISSDQTITVPPLALTGLGMTVGAAAAAVLNLTGIMPAQLVFTDVTFAGLEMSWMVPAALLVLFTIGAYTCGVIGLRFLGPTVGSFVNLSEVPLAAIAAWVILTETLSPLQLLGAAVILIGICCVKAGDLVHTHHRLHEPRHFAQ